ncbi:MAG TPA: Mu transposase C-terminal domain-containing protein [Ktedonobacteraceae bacterium]|jgi:hypothetical protein
MQLYVDTLVQWTTTTPEPLVERILWIDPTGVHVVTIDISAKNKKARPTLQRRARLEHALAAGDARLLELDPYGYLKQPDEHFPSEHRDQREAAWKVLQQILKDDHGQDRDGIFLPHVLRPLIRTLHRTTGLDKRTISGYLQRYWQRGQMKNALLPDYTNCGAPGVERINHTLGEPKRGTLTREKKAGQGSTGVNIDEEAKEHLRRGIKLFYEVDDKPTLKKAWDLTIARFFNRGFERRSGVLVPITPPINEAPTYNQFWYWYHKERDPATAIIAREGRRAFDLHKRAILGSASQGVQGPGALFQLDATVGDTYLVSKFDRSRIIGRPVIYIIIDIFSRLITGMSVSLEGPSWLGALLALENMAMEKVAFCKEYGYEIRPQDWPSHHLPRAILGDRGEMLSKNSDRLSNVFDIRIDNTPPYRPDWKPIVERNFHLLDEMVIHWTPGTTYDHPERGGHDYRLDACLTLDELRWLLIDCIIEHNTAHRVSNEVYTEEMMRDGVEPYPRDIWLWGAENKRGLRDPEPPEVIRRTLLPEGTASITPEGIYFQGLHYECQLAHEEGWFVEARDEGRHKPVRVHYHPRCAREIYVELEKDHQGKDRPPERCTLTSRDARFEGYDYDEIADFFALQKLQAKEDATYERQERIAHHFLREHKIQEAQKKTAEALGEVSKAERLQITDNRLVERQLEAERSMPPSGTTTKVVTEAEADSEEDTFEFEQIAWLRQKRDGGTPNE